MCENQRQDILFGNHLENSKYSCLLEYWLIICLIVSCQVISLISSIILVRIKTFSGYKSTGTWQSPGIRCFHWCYSPSRERRGVFCFCYLIAISLLYSILKSYMIYFHICYTCYELIAMSFMMRSRDSICFRYLNTIWLAHYLLKSYMIYWYVCYTYMHIHICCIYMLYVCYIFALYIICCTCSDMMRSKGSICFRYLNTIWSSHCPLKSYMSPPAISLCHLHSKWLETYCLELVYVRSWLRIYSQSSITLASCEESLYMFGLTGIYDHVTGPKWNLENYETTNGKESKGNTFSLELSFYCSGTLKMLQWRFKVFCLTKLTRYFGNLYLNLCITHSSLQHNCIYPRGQINITYSLQQNAKLLVDMFSLKYSFCFCWMICYIVIEVYVMFQLKYLLCFHWSICYGLNIEGKI